PNQFRVTSAGDVLMDCDWPAMMAMIRDLEERIAGETETDTTYGVHVSGGINGNDLNMWYDCLVLRDSILSLQVAYDEALAPRVTVDAAVVLSDTSAALSASFSGSGVEASGFAWAEDYTTTPQQGNDTGTSSPIADTLTGLDAGTFYYFSAYAVKEAEYFYGDTLSLLTMPGITTDAADELTTVSATLNATFSADSITAQGFVWGSQADLSDGASVSADTTGGSTTIEYAVSGLTPGKVRYVSAYATNASGTTYGDTIALLTSPGITTDAADELAAVSATLNATFSADSITAQGFVWGLQADLSDGANVSADSTGGSTAIEYSVSGLTPGTIHYVSAYATNASGTTYGDTIALLTSPGITTDAADELTAESATLNSTFSADSITAQGFVWGLQSDLSDGTNVSADTTGGSTAIEYALTGLTEDATYYFSAYATNASGTTYGDTLSFVAQQAPCGDLTSVSYEDYDYDIVVIGTQCWFKENLRNEKYNDGSAIPTELNDAAWSTTTDGAVAVYNNDETAYLADYGRLYNWYAVNTGNLCPSGWHVPTNVEYVTLEMSLGMSESEAYGTGGRGTDQGTQMKSSPEDNPSWDGTNTSGFSGLAGGSRSNDGDFDSGGNTGYFWSASAVGTFAYRRALAGGNAQVNGGSNKQRYGLSVRCVRD
ncbi:hypothetical protein N9233_02755, partial [Flavobacteriales bacterium]|nr:hypothetical protein [Flavobacteriales bacterium]